MDCTLCLGAEQGGTPLGSLAWTAVEETFCLQAWARRMGRWCSLGVLVAVAAVSLWTPLMSQTIAQRWFTWPNILFLAPVPILTALIALAELRVLGGHDPDAAPFLWAVLLFLMSYLGIAISLFPMTVPPHYTLRQAASSESTHAFLLAGTLFLLPIIAMHSGWSYWVFRGKVRGDAGYH